MRDDASQPTPAGWRCLGLILGCALVLRLLHLWQLRSAPFFEMLMGDARGYDAWARRIAAGEWLGDQVFYQAPLYPYFLGSIYSTLGDAVWQVRLVQCLMGAASCAILAAATARWAGRRAGWIAGLMMAAYPPAIFFDALLQKPVLDLLLIAILLWWMARLHERRQALRLVAAGATIGLLTLVRENALVLLPVVGLWVTLRQFRPPRLDLRRGALLLAGGALVLGPVAIRNFAIGGEFQLTTSQFGANFYMGNNEYSDGLHVPMLPFRDNVQFEQQDAIDIAAQALGHAPSPAEVSRYWSGRASEFIREQPLDWLALTARKFALFWNRVEVLDTEDQYTYAEWSSVLRWIQPLWNLGLLAPLALLALWVEDRRRRDWWPLYLWLAAYTAATLLFFIFARYRVQVVPLLVLLAAAALAGLPRWWRAAKARARATAAAAFACALLFCNWPLVDSAHMRAGMRTNIGGALLERGDLDGAREQFELALSIQPENAIAHFNLGHLLQSRGRQQESAEHYRKALERNPAFAQAHHNLALALAALGRPAEARVHYEASLRLNPGNALAHNNLGNLALGEGRVELALQHYRQALALDDALLEAHFNLAVLLGRSGQTAEALPHLRRVVEGDPGNRQAAALLQAAEAGAP